MAKSKSKSVALAYLQSTESTQRLDQIARLRNLGIGEHVDLPQLVVAGDQSAGKSSVLNGVTKIPFPRQDGVCTKFPTEINLRNQSGDLTITATILPDASRSDDEKQTLASYRKSLDGYDQLPDVIAEASQLMHIRGFGGFDDGPAFATDVLRVDVSGDTGLDLTVVDLPGLIFVSNDDQTDDDIDLVSNLVDSYLKNPRTIILAVVQAPTDIAVQPIIQRAKRFDPAGQRTVGIITKPDLMNTGTEGRITALVKNQDSTKLKLGFFLLKNASPAQLAEAITPENVLRQERQFFQSPPWKDQKLDPSRLGVESLQKFLQKLLAQHIDRELPKVVNEVRSLLADSKKELDSLGAERPTSVHLREYASKLARDLDDLVRSALDGMYSTSNPKFFRSGNPEKDPHKLRARVHKINGQFAQLMQEGAQARRITESPVSGQPEPSRTIDYPDSDAPGETGGPEEVTEAEMMKWVERAYENNRGLELEGSYNPGLLAELFHEQSSRWDPIAMSHLDDVNDLVCSFVKKAMSFIIPDESVRRAIEDYSEPTLQDNLDAATKELKQLISDERQQLITYNPDFIDQLKREQLGASQKVIEAAKTSLSMSLEAGFQSSSVAEQIVATMENLTIEDKNRACTEALMALNQYYTVAMKRFVDNVCRQVIERHLLARLRDIFPPEKVASLPDEELQRIAAEPASTIEQREQLKVRVRDLQQGLKELRA